jgi:hypothetical protein
VVIGAKAVGMALKTLDPPHQDFWGKYRREFMLICRARRVTKGELRKGKIVKNLIFKARFLKATMSR